MCVRGLVYTCALVFDENQDLWKAIVFRETIMGSFFSRKSFGRDIIRFLNLAGAKLTHCIRLFQELWIYRSWEKKKTFF